MFLPQDQFQCCAVDRQRSMLENAEYLCSLGCSCGAATYVRQYLDIWGCIMVMIYCDDDDMCDGMPYWRLLVALVRHKAITRTAACKLRKLHTLTSEYIHGRREDAGKLRLIIDHVRALCPNPFENLDQEDGQ
jgi:hypothetical protein